MSLPEVTMNVRDGALGIIPQSPAQAHVKIGVAIGGVANTLYGFSSVQALVDSLVGGQAVEAAAVALSVAGGANPVYVMPINRSVAGKLSAAVTHVGTGLGTVTPGLATWATIIILITTTGALGAGKFTYQVGNGPASAPVTIPGGGTFAVPGTLTTITFNGAGNFTAGDTYTLDLVGGITAGGGNVGPGAVSAQVSDPVDDFEVIIQVLKAGAIGTGTFKYSLDGGDSYSPEITIPSGGGGKYALVDGKGIGTGIFVTFANGGGAFVLGDTYSFTATGAGYSNTDVTNALVALAAQSQEFGFVHIVGIPVSSAAAASLASTVDTQMVAMAAVFRYVWAFIEAPTVGSLIVSGGASIPDSADTDTVLAAAFSSFVSTRISVGAGDEEMVSPLSGRIIRRNEAWGLAARAALVPIGEDLARVARGVVPFVTALYRDEAATPALDAARFCTMRTYRGLAGFFPTNAFTMGQLTSDYHLLQNRRVMDEACRITRAALLKYLNEGVRVDKNTGFILEQDARAIEADVNAQLSAALVATGQASDASVQLSRTTNILSTSAEPVTVRITPLGYLKQISVDIGFLNPALQAAA